MHTAIIVSTLSDRSPPSCLPLLFLSLSLSIHLWHSRFSRAAFPGSTSRGMKRKELCAARVRSKNRGKTRKMGFEARFTEHRLFFPDRWTVQSFRNLFANPGYCRSTFSVVNKYFVFGEKRGSIRDSSIRFENSLTFLADKFA